MTRLDASNEPSMEDILASIRKIIAEEPPGSRPVPPAAPRATASPLQQAVFGRTLTAEAPTSNEPAASASVTAPEPYLRAMPAKGESKTFISSPFFMPKSETAPAARVEPSFAPLSMSVETQVASAAAPAAVPTPNLETPNLQTLSVEDQLTELLGDAVLAGPEVVGVGDAPETPAASATAQLNTASRIDAKPIGRPGPALDMNLMAGNNGPIANAQPHLEARPNFTVSRDGYVPTVSTPESDPFSFDLGPSPFQSKELETPEPVLDPRASLTSVLDAEEQADASAASVGAAELDLSAVTTQAELATEQSSGSGIETISSQEAVFVLPSIAATLQPEPQLPVAQAAAAEEQARAVQPSNEFATSLPNVSTVSAAEAFTSFQYPATSSTTPGAASTLLHTAPLPAAFERNSMMLPDVAQRSMEDTVADLLRPMLKTWLAENMPKIVERALRRETSERLLSEHKSAAE